MSRIAIPSLDDAPAASKQTLDAVNKQLGVVPNLFRLIGSSPAALTAFASFQGALTKTLDVKTRERIALAVAQVNGCDYCLSAHTYLGLNLAKISPEEIALNRKGRSGDPKANAAVAFACKSPKSTATSPTLTSRRSGRPASPMRRSSRSSRWSRKNLHQLRQQRCRHRHRLPGGSPQRSRQGRLKPASRTEVPNSAAVWLSCRQAIMSYGFLDIAVTPSVRATQAEMGLVASGKVSKAAGCIGSLRTKPRSSRIATASILPRSQTRLAIRPTSRRSARLPQGDRRQDVGVRRLSRQSAVLIYCRLPR